MREPAISEPLTWKEICQRYPDEWVALVEVGWTNEQDFEFSSLVALDTAATETHVVPEFLDDHDPR